MASVLLLHVQEEILWPELATDPARFYLHSSASLDFGLG